MHIQVTCKLLMIKVHYYPLSLSIFSQQLLSLTSAEVWTHFIAHNLIKEDPVFKKFLPNVLKVAREKLIKVTYSSYVCM